MRTLTVLLLSLALTAAPAMGVTPYLVKDINSRYVPASSEPHDLFSLGDVALFETERPLGVTLWRSDGSASGTYPLLEAGDTQPMALTPDRFFFLAHAVGERQGHLWVSDGSLPGTFQLTEERLSSFGWLQSGRAVWMSAQQTLYFSASDAVHGEELWRTDGTPAGTYEVADIWPGQEHSSPHELTNFKGKVYFVAASPERGFELWRSDGTPQGTVPVRDTAQSPPSDYPSALHVVGSRLVFVEERLQSGSKLWVSDGTARGTHPLTDRVRAQGYPAFEDFAVHGRRLYFVANVFQGKELWVTDGTAKGTRLLKRFALFDDPLPRSSLPGRLIFTAFEWSHGWELWTTDGTVKGTHLLRDLCPGTCGGASGSPVLHQGKLYFRGNDGVRGFELWVTDGTRAGTHLVRDICPGECASWPNSLHPLGSRQLFVADDGIHAREIWGTDGTAPGTVALTDSEWPVSSLSGAKAGAMLIFAFSDPEHGAEPWCTDGTPEGTVLLSDLADEDIGGSHPGGLMALSGTALFFADDGEHGYELWKSNGTVEGTSLVTEIVPGELPSVRPETEGWTTTPSQVIFNLKLCFERPALATFVRMPPPPPYTCTDTLWATQGDGAWRLTPEGVSSRAELRPPAALGSRVWFPAADPEHGEEPWITDGTLAGTHLLADLVPGQAPSTPRDFMAFQGQMWFVASERYDAHQLWKSDGTAAGTIAVGPVLSGMSSPVLFKDRLWFTTEDAEHGAELWSSDGSEGGTVPVLALMPGMRHLHPELFTYRERLYISMSASQELWVSDGTEAGTQKVSGQAVCPGSPRPAVLQGLLFYLAYPQCGLVVSDGTEAGTRSLRTDDGGLLDQIAEMVPFAHRLLVTTYDGELWQTDGTDTGTTLLHEGVEPELLRAGFRLFFSAFDPKTGWELWAVHE